MDLFQSCNILSTQFPLCVPNKLCVAAKLQWREWKLGNYVLKRNFEGYSEIWKLLNMVDGADGEKPKQAQLKSNAEIYYSITFVFVQMHTFVFVLRLTST